MLTVLKESTGFDDVFGSRRGRTKSVTAPVAAPYARLAFPQGHPYVSMEDASWRSLSNDYIFYYSPARGCVLTLDLTEFDEEEMSNWGSDDAHEFQDFIAGQTTVQAVVLEDPLTYSEIARNKNGLFLVCEQSELISMEVYSHGESKSFPINVYMLTNMLKEVPSGSRIYNVACNEMPAPITVDTVLYGRPENTRVFNMTQAMVDNYDDYSMEEWEIDQLREQLTADIASGHEFTFTNGGVSFRHDSRYAHHVVTDTREEIWSVSGEMECRLNLKMSTGETFTFDCKLADLNPPIIPWTKEIGNKTINTKQFMKEWK